MASFSVFGLLVDDLVAQADGKGCVVEASDEVISIGARTVVPVLSTVVLDGIVADAQVDFFSSGNGTDAKGGRGLVAKSIDGGSLGVVIDDVVVNLEGDIFSAEGNRDPISRLSKVNDEATGLISSKTGVILSGVLGDVLAAPAGLHHSVAAGVHSPWPPLLTVSQPLLSDCSSLGELGDKAVPTRGLVAQLEMDGWVGAGRDMGRLDGETGC
ncbi:hypothetical protein Dimus_034085 [Dionaea muscipula]